MKTVPATSRDWVLFRKWFWEMRDQMPDPTLRQPPLLNVFKEHTQFVMVAVVAGSVPKSMII